MPFRVAATAATAMTSAKAVRSVFIIALVLLPFGSAVGHGMDDSIAFDDRGARHVLVSASASSSSISSPSAVGREPMDDGTRDGSQTIGTIRRRRELQKIEGKEPAGAVIVLGEDREPKGAVILLGEKEEEREEEEEEKKKQSKGKKERKKEKNSMLGSGTGSGSGSGTGPGQKLAPSRGKSDCLSQAVKGATRYLRCAYGLKPKDRNDPAVRMERCREGDGDNSGGGIVKKEEIVSHTSTLAENDAVCVRMLASTPAGGGTRAYESILRLCLRNSRRRRTRRQQQLQLRKDLNVESCVALSRMYLRLAITQDDDDDDGGGNVGKGGGGKKGPAPSPGRDEVPPNTSCPTEARNCPDGTVSFRDPNIGCDFVPCDCCDALSEPGKFGNVEPPKLGVGRTGKRYVCCPDGSWGFPSGNKDDKYICEGQETTLAYIQELREEKIKGPIGILGQSCSVVRRKEDGRTKCPGDTETCPDGSSVGRNWNTANCEFDRCALSVCCDPNDYVACGGDGIPGDARCCPEDGKWSCPTVDEATGRTWYRCGGGDDDNDGEAGRWVSADLGPFGLACSANDNGNSFGTSTGMAWTTVPAQDGGVDYSCDLSLTIDCRTVDSDLPCSQITPPISSCSEPAIWMLLRYDEAGCDNVKNSQDDGGGCNDFDGGPAEAKLGGAHITVAVTDSGAVEVFAGRVPNGDTFQMKAPVGSSTLGDMLDITIRTSKGGELLQRCELRINCGETNGLSLLSRCGAVEVLGFYNPSQGEVTIFAEAEFTYTVTHLSSQPELVDVVSLDITRDGLGPRDILPLLIEEQGGESAIATETHVIDTTRNFNSNPMITLAEVQARTFLPGGAGVLTCQTSAEYILD